LLPVRLILPAGQDPEFGLPGPGDDEAAAALARLYRYPGPAPDQPATGQPWIRANMVASADGAASLDGRSGGLSGPGDEAVFAVLRSLADVIVVGVTTARTERYQPVRPSEIWSGLRAGRAATPPIAVVTSRMTGLSPDDPLFAAGPGQARTIVLTTEQAPAGLRAAVAERAEVVVAGAASVAPAAVAGALAGRGQHRILVEGGPGLLAQFAAAGQLDELCLTISPVLAGGHAGRILAASASGPPEAASLRLAHVLEDQGQLICRYLRPASSPA
jgi:riboflavin biosynthesis pyrimidine reductase